MGHDEREAYAQVILGRSREYGCLPHQPVHNIRNARGYPARKILWKEAGYVPIAYVHIPDKKRQKLDPNSEKCILIGYSLEQKGYKCFNPSTRKVRVSWYAHELTPPGTSTNDLDNTEDNDQLRSIPDESLISTRLSRPQEPPSN